MARKRFTAEQRANKLREAELQSQGQTAAQASKHIGETDQTEELAKLAHELARSNDAFEEHAHFVSHDIKTPLWVIGYALDWIRQQFGSQFDEDTEKIISGAEDGVVQARGVVNKLLAYAKVNLKERALKPTSAASAAELAIFILEDSVESSASQIEVGELPVVLGDEALLVQLFRNLIANAIRCRSDAPPLITVSAAFSQPFWVFSVADCGMGLQPSELPRLFDLFESGRNEDPEGKGLGLAICKRIVELHGGRIWVESKPQSGSTFHFTLPACPAKT